MRLQQASQSVSQGFTKAKMDIVKNYIISAINEASNKLRLNPEKIQILNSLEEWISSRENLNADIQVLKRITETSKLSIRLQDITNYLSFEKIDYKKFSEKFLEHSLFLVADLDFLLLSVNTLSFKKILNRVETLKSLKMEEQSHNLKIELDQAAEEFQKVQKAASGKRSMKIEKKLEPELPLIYEDPPKKEKRKLIEEERDFLYAPLKDLEELLQRMKKEDFRSSEVFRFSDIFEERLKFCKLHGLKELIDAYSNLAGALLLIYNKEMTVNKDILDYFRAAMIVVVTEIRGLDHDITEYRLRNQLFTESLKVYKG